MSDDERDTASPAEPQRSFVAVDDHQTLSALLWGSGEPWAALLHGRGQNAFTWTSAARILGRSMIAADLPGHGYSDWRDDHDYGPWPNAEAVATVLEALAPRTEVVVGMSLGGTTAIRLTARHPELVRRLVVIDTTPATVPGGLTLTDEQRGAVSLLEGPVSFDSFEEMLELTASKVPRRSLESLRAGVMRNSRQREDGRWIWRYDRERPAAGHSPADRSLLWEDLSVIGVPLMLVVAGRSGRVQPEAVAEFLSRQPSTRIEHVADSGHSVQSDQPETLAALIKDFVATT